MNITIKNEMLTVTLSTLGAEMRSIRDADGTEYLWNGDPAYWAKRAPNLFPYVGRLTDNTYRLNGKSYTMDRHGFAAHMEFAVEDYNDNAVSFRLEDTAATLAMYPYHFALRISYRLSGKRLNITFTVENKDAETMAFGLGGHPGFRVPLESGIRFEDYMLEFGEAATPVHIGFSPEGFCSGLDMPFTLQDGLRLPLSHDLFDNDAIVLSGMAGSVTLKRICGRKALRVEYPDMHYLGLWHKPLTDAPYICIEPWTSLPSRQDIVEDLLQQENLISLPSGRIYENTWAIDVLTYAD